MTNEEAREIFLNRGFVNGLFDGDKWRQSIVVISKWLKQEPCKEYYREFIEILVNYPPADLCTYPEYKGKPYFSIKYRENGKTYVGFGTYKIEILSQWIKEYFMPSIQPKPKTDEPMQVELEGDGYSDGKLVYDYGKCPKCGWQFEYGEKDWEEPYCCHCGQRLHWFESEEV